MQHTQFTQQLKELPCPEEVKTRALKISETLSDGDRQKLFAELKDLSLQFATVSAEETKLMDQMETHVLHGEKVFAAADRKEKENADRKNDDNALTTLLDA
jgi:hypothetical protein